MVCYTIKAPTTVVPVHLEIDVKMRCVLTCGALPSITESWPSNGRTRSVSTYIDLQHSSRLQFGSLPVVGWCGIIQARGCLIVEAHDTTHHTVLQFFPRCWRKEFWSFNTTSPSFKAQPIFAPACYFAMDKQIWHTSHIVGWQNNTCRYFVRIIIIPRLFRMR